MYFWEIQFYNHKTFDTWFKIELTSLGLFLNRNLEDYNNSHIPHGKFIFCRLEFAGDQLWNWSTFTKLTKFIFLISAAGWRNHHKVSRRSAQNLHALEEGKNLLFYPPHRELHSDHKGKLVLIQSRVLCELNKAAICTVMSLFLLWCSDHTRKRLCICCTD